MHNKYDSKDYNFYNKDNNQNVVYKIQTISKNYIFYKCRERPKCPGRGKLDLKREKFVIINDCDFKINHDKITFEEFLRFNQKNKLKELNFENNKKLHRFYVKAAVINKKFKDIPTLISDFKTDTGIDLCLTRTEINNIKYENTDNYNYLSSLELV